MGRHSISYLAAQQGPPAAGAAHYVGGVGALALVLGVGAAMSGGAGVAYADGTAGNETGGGTPAHSSPEPSSATAGSDDAPKDKLSGAVATTPTSASASTSTSTSTSTAGSTSTTVPKMQGLSGGVETNREKAAESEPDSLAGLISRIPHQIAAAFAGAVAPRASTPTTGDPGSGDRSPVEEPKTTADDAGTTFVKTATENLATALRGPSQPVGVVPSTPVNTTSRQRLTASPAVVEAARSAPTLAAPTLVTPAPTAPIVANPIATVVSVFLNALGLAPTASTGHTPIAPIPLVLGVLQLISREIERIFVHHAPSTASFTSAEAYANAHPANASTAPGPDDQTATAYGDIGKWMLERDGQISNYGGQPYGGKELLESVNVIIVDPSAKDPVDATYRLNNAMWWSGFPAQPIHSTGFQGSIDDNVYGQQPTGLLEGFSDNLFLLPNDHGRIFGPDPVQTSKGYVWSGAFSTETLTIYNFLPGHAYVSSDMARTALATRLILSGKARFVGMVPLDNAYNTGTTTTGDHDGYAVVLQLT